MILARLKSRFTGAPVYKKKKVLVLEGGGMRGIFLTGVLQAFSDRGYFPWRLIIGSSAGALTGTAYAARQIHRARDAYFGELLSGKIIKISNILRPERHILNLDWMVDNIISGEEPLDLRTLRRSCPVLITATDCKADNMPRTVYLDSRRDDVATSLKATAAIPFLYRGFVEYGSYHLLDGGLLDPIPYKKALAMGFKEDQIVVMVTRQRGYRKKEESFWIKAIYESYYKNPRFRFLVEILQNRFELYNRELDDLERVYTGIRVIYPPAQFRVDRLTRDVKRVIEGFGMGINSGKSFLKEIRV